MDFSQILLSTQSPGIPLLFHIFHTWLIIFLFLIFCNIFILCSLSLFILWYYLSLSLLPLLCSSFPSFFPSLFVGVILVNIYIFLFTFVPLVTYTTFHNYNYIYKERHISFRGINIPFHIYLKSFSLGKPSYFHSHINQTIYLQIIYKPLFFVWY